MKQKYLLGLPEHIVLWGGRVNIMTYPRKIVFSKGQRRLYRMFDGSFVAHFPRFTVVIS